MFSMCCNSHIKLWRNKKKTQRITKLIPFINKYNWEGINYPSGKDDWKKFEKDSVTIAINALYAKGEKKYILLFQNIIQIEKNKLFF